MLRKVLSLFALAWIFWASNGFAATNALLYEDNFERYTNGTPLIDGTNYWYASSAEAIVQTNVVAAGTNAAMIPVDVTLSNRYETNLPNTWLHMQSRIIRYDGPTNVTYDTNLAAVFYFNSNGYCVVRNGTNGWATITNTLTGQPAEQINSNSFTTLDVYLDYTNKTWRLNVNSIQLTNNIGFANTNAANFDGFDIYNGGQATTYLDNVAAYALPALSVSPSALTNTARYQVDATSQSFQVISRGAGQLDYYVTTNNAYTNWSMTITNNGAGSLTNNSTNTVWIQYDTDSLSPGTYTNSFNVNSTNLEGEVQTVQIVLNVYSMSVNPTNLANAVLRGYNATSQTFGVSAGGYGISFSAAADDGGLGWLSVSPASGTVAAGETNTLTNTYLTANLSPGDYTGQVTVTTTAGGGATGVVSISMRVFATPILRTDPALIRQVVDKGGNPTGEYFTVRNASATPLLNMAYHVAVTSNAASIIQGVEPADGINTGQYDTIGVYFNNLSGLSAGTYTAIVAVVATNYGSGYAGSWTATSNINVVMVIATPDSPSQVNASKGTYEDRVAVNWQPAVSPLGNAVTYNVLRHTTFDPDYANTIVSGLTVTNYNDTTGSPGVRYYYWVQSVNSYGQIGSNSVPDSGYRLLSAPGGLFATDGEYTNKVVVSWAAVDGAVAYSVYRSAGGPVAMVYYTADTEYEDNTVIEGVEYTYYVQATNSICGSVLSAGETGYVLSRPAVLSASAGQYVGKIVVSWNAVPGATAYELWRSTATLTPPYGGGAKIKETAALSYSDTAVTSGTNYYYWLKSKNATALSGFSARAEGYAATATVDLSPWSLVVLPRRIGLGAHPRVVSFRLANNGATALSGDNGTVQLTLYASANNVPGDADDQLIGAVTAKLTLSQNASGIFSIGAGNIALPAAAGSYYLFMRLNPVWPSTLAPTSLGGWVTWRTGALAVSADGSINYQAMNDYNADGGSDLTVHGSGLWDARTVDGFEFARNGAFGGNGSVVMGDYDGDCKTDPVIYNEGSGLWQGLLSGSGYAYAAGLFGGPGHHPVPGDYDGDGKTDLAIYDTANSLWYAWKIGSGWLMQGIQFGSLGYEPVIGDYDGDGIWDLAIYNKNNGLWYVRSVAGAAILIGGRWGAPTCRPVPGDYDGDGLWDFAIYDEATGRWYIVNIYSEIIVNGALWGAAGYRPVSGDFDGDGISDLAVYNSTSGKWFIRTVSGVYLLLDATWGGAGREAVGEVE